MQSSLSALFNSCWPEEDTFQWHRLGDLISFPQTSPPKCFSHFSIKLGLLTTPLLWESLGEIFKIQTTAIYYAPTANGCVLGVIDFDPFRYICRLYVRSANTSHNMIWEVSSDRQLHWFVFLWVNPGWVGLMVSQIQSWFIFSFNFHEPVWPVGEWQLLWWWISLSPGPCAGMVTW